MSSKIANPRLTRPQHTFTVPSITCVYCQYFRPVTASKATTSFGICTVYITSSTTRGVASYFSSDRLWKTHFSSRSPTFSRLIWSSGEWCRLS